MDSRDIAGGFMMVFQWEEGDCMGRMYFKQHRKFANLLIETKRVVFKYILSLN